MGCCALLQGIFPTQGSNPHHLDPCIDRQVLYHLCHLGRNITKSLNFEGPESMRGHPHAVCEVLGSACQLLPRRQETQGPRLSVPSLASPEPFPPASLWPHPPRRLCRPPGRHPMAVMTIISILYESFNPEGQARHLLFPFER